MKFDSQSVLLNDGVNIQVNINLPKIFDNYTFSPEMWSKTISGLNKLLNERSSVTTEINGKKVDILQVEPRDPFAIKLVVNKDDIEFFGSTWFSIKGQLVFEENSWDKVEKILISDLIYKDAEGNTHGLLNKS